MSAVDAIGAFPKSKGKVGKITVVPHHRGQFKNHTWEPGKDARPQAMNGIGQRTPGKECWDCGADFQFISNRWRCPWVTPSDWAAGRGMVDVVTCGRPFKRTDNPMVIGSAKAI